MEIDDGGWTDLDERLRASSHDPADLSLLVDHVENRLISHFGVDVVDIWLGKDGTRRHAIREIAAASVAHLLPVIDTVDHETIKTLHETQAIDTDMPPPWDDHWRANPRTASWRS